MELQTWIKVLCIIQILQDMLQGQVHSMSPEDCHGTRYYRAGSGTNARCCLKCEAGQRVVKHCTKGKPTSTQCRECSENTYQPEPTGKLFCERCNRQMFGHRIVLSNCTRTTDLTYGDCKEGYYFQTGILACKKCSSCPVGSGVLKKCGKRSDTTCSGKCRPGTYSDKNSPTQRCRTCTPCSSNEEMFRGCTESSNYGCWTRTTSSSQPTPTSVAVTTTSAPMGPVTGNKSSSGREWVMPFFMSAMALLLVLFLIFVIGVAVWCHRHSRRKEQRAVMERLPDVELVKPEKAFIEEAQMTLLPKQERYAIVKLPKKVRENGMMLRDVSLDTIEELANYLNPNSTSNWRKVASKLGFSWSIISNLALNPTRATQDLLGRWGTKQEATVFNLYRILKEIERDDAADILERLLVEPTPSCPKSV